MAEILWPTVSYPNSMELQESSTFIRGFSQYTNKSKAVDTLNATWNANATIDIRNGDAAAATEAFIHGLRSGANTVYVPVFYRMTPRGTQTANTTTSATITQGTATITLVSTTGLTLLAGDFVEIDNLLFRVTDNATAVANVLTLSVFPRARRTIAAGSFARLQSPGVRMKLIEPVSAVWARGGVLQPTSLVLQEHIA